tara:strand:- start:12892 stop:13998 length:1107 start_codon:yes stop_codon:yes gene_type:complete
MNYKIIVFANTLWFIEKFKFKLIKELSLHNKVECLYLREGPPSNQSNIIKLKNKEVKFIKLNFYNFIILFFKQFIYKDNSSLRILVFTFSPILISQIIFFKRKNIIIYVIEGLGRVFSSRKILLRFFKRFLIFIYRFIFNGARSIVTLNYSDACFLAKMNIAKLSKIKTIPGTGYDLPSNKEDLISKNNNPIFIDYVARLIDDKGYYSFVNIQKYINRHIPLIRDNYTFRIITPQSDINKLEKEEINCLKKEGIILKPYLEEPYEYYKNTNVLIIPTQYGEGLSRILLESIVLGIPVIVSRNMGTEELLPYDYKYFIISDNPASIANQLNDLIINREECIKIIERQKEVILQNYSSRASIDSFIQIFK